MILKKRNLMSLTKKAWMRYFARNIDIFIGANIVAIVLGFMIGSAFYYSGMPLNIDESFFSIFFPIASLMIYLFIEAIIIAKFKTTIGKKIFGIKIANGDNQNLSAENSIKRNFILWIKGMALGIPIVSLIALIIAFNNYTQNGETSWDEAVNSNVSFENISNLRFYLGIAAWVLTLFLNIYLNNAY